MTVPLVIFLAEDNPADVLLVRRALGAHKVDFELFVAGDGDEVGSLLERTGADIPRPDLLLLDLNLPRIDAEELFRRVRAHPACSTVPLIVVSSSDSPKDHAWTSKYDVSHYFRKPSDLKQFLELGEVVRRLTEKC